MGYAFGFEQTQNRTSHAKPLHGVFLSSSTLHAEKEVEAVSSTVQWVEET
jgi:hypothetical protein